MIREMDEKIGTDYFTVILLLSVLIATIWSALFSIIETPVYLLNENQLLYLFSVMAQVIGGLFGLTLTAYVFFTDKIKDLVKTDNTLYDATSALLSRCFHYLIFIAAICGSTIFFCILGIAALHNWTEGFPFLINESTLLFLIGTVATLVFGIQLLDPNAIAKESDQIKRETEGYYSPTTSADRGDFTEFLQTYNQLENIIKEFALVCMRGTAQRIDSSNFSFNKPQILQSLDILNSSEIINGLLQDEINRLRKYRNGVTHSTGKIVVSESACKRVRQILETISNAYTVYIKPNRTPKEWETAVQKIYDLTRDV